MEPSFIALAVVIALLLLVIGALIWKGVDYPDIAPWFYEIESKKKED